MKNLIEKNLSQTILPNYFYRLGTLYLNGIGVESNIDLAEEYLLKSENSGMEADLSLSTLYYLQKYNKVNLEKACMYLEKLVKIDYFKDVIFYYNLCSMVNNEIYNQKSACKFLKKHLKSNPRACYIYAVCIKRGVIDDQKCNVEELLKYAVNSNIDGAVYEYVDTLKQKGNVDNNYLISLLESNITDVNSMYELACMYESSDIDKAIELLKKCIEKSSLVSMLELGKIYSDKKYNKFDLELAKYYLNMAKANGMIIADIELMKLKKKYE